ncbi:MAG: dTDP-4-dehydrorhamnose reductase [Bacteroidales bacterium]|jgi:dTDP-4-dehydrorhamnose reductase|nr:dTDP-4-dehydrorhamnose reductase [Bacteroidales bacterium]
MKTILVTGAYGQLGSEMKVVSKKFPQHAFIFTDADTLNITSEEELQQFFNTNKVDCIVNCAAYTAVDKAEDDKETAYAINSEAVRLLAKIAAKNNIKLIHISTDYVFDGKSYMPYSEDMAICPQTVYGQSKADGERAVMEIASNQAVIIRTSWLYSSFGNNFVKTMLRLGTEKEVLNVIFDQIGTPTYAADLATAIMQVVNAEQFVPGIYHFSNEGVCSWYDFTIAIHREAGITSCKVNPIETKDYPAKTPRPHYSVLNKSKIKKTYDFEISHWEDGLQRCLKQLTINN